MKVKPKLSD